MVDKWLSVVGIGEDGLSGLSSIARFLVDRAQVVVGGARHLAMLPTDDTREQLLWTSPLLLKFFLPFSMNVFQAYLLRVLVFVG